MRRESENMRNEMHRMCAATVVVLALVGERPKPLRKVALSSGAQRAALSLRKKGLVQLCGFTPSDAAHVLGLQANWSQPAARLAAQLQSPHCIWPGCDHPTSRCEVDHLHDHARGGPTVTGRWRTYRPDGNEIR